MLGCYVIVRTLRKRMILPDHGSRFLHDLSKIDYRFLRLYEGCRVLATLYKKAVAA